MKNFFIGLSFMWLGVFAVGCTGSERLKSAGSMQKHATVKKITGKGLLGRSFDSMNQNERRKALEAEYKSLEHTKAGETVVWKAQTGVTYGTVISGQLYRVGTQNCRQYSHKFVVNGEKVRFVRGSACRNSDGSWSPLT